MRNRKLVVGALACTMALGAYGIAQADQTTQTQTMYGDAAPIKVPQKGFQGLKKFDIGVETLDTAPNGRGGTNQPYPSTQTIIDFDNDIKFTIKGVPYNQVNKNNSLGQCTAQISGKSATEAKQLCGKALVGGGDAEANLFGTLIPATVTAFNGAPVGGKPVILLHSDPGFDQFVLPGTAEEVQLRRGRLRSAALRKSHPVPLGRCGHHQLPHQRWRSHLQAEGQEVQLRVRATALTRTRRGTSTASSSSTRTTPGARLSSRSTRRTPRSARSSRARRSSSSASSRTLRGAANWPPLFFWEGASPGWLTDPVRGWPGVASASGRAGANRPTCAGQPWSSPSRRSRKPRSASE